MSPSEPPASDAPGPSPAAPRPAEPDTSSESGLDALRSEAPRDELFELPLELPSITGLSILGEERLSSAGVIHTGWLSRGGRVRVILSRLLPTPERREQWSRYVTTYQALENDVLPAVRLADVQSEVPYVVVSDPGGLSLTKVLARHGIPRFAWSAGVMLQVAKALAALHERGVLHCDIQPATIHVDAVSGTPRIVTPGLFQPQGSLLRKAIRDDVSQGLAAASMLAPELVDPATFGEVGVEADIYALGATLYTLVSGTPPFTGGTTATVLRKVTREDPSPLGRLNDDVPETLEALCVACLKRQPRDRPSSMAPVIEALEKLATSGAPGPVSATRVIQVIGDYRVVSIRERRGATVVYEVISKDHSRPLSLELGPVRNDDTELSLRRQREVVQRIEEHPNILRIHDIGLHEGRRFTITDLIDARTLEDLLAEGPLPVRRAAEVTRDIARALAFCHNYGVVHRGARPDLILVENEKGRALLTSLGRAPDVAEEGGGPTTLVSKGLLFSTLFYFAPEQINDNVGPIDGQTDVYVLGVTLYETLTGRRPFAGDGPRALLASIVAGEPRSPQALNHQVDADMAAICLKALRIEKTERYLTAQELCNDLELWLEGKPVRARSRSVVGATLRRLARRARISARRALSLVFSSLEGRVG